MPAASLSRGQRKLRLWNSYSGLGLCDSLGGERQRLSQHPSRVRLPDLRECSTDDRTLIAGAGALSAGTWADAAPEASSAPTSGPSGDSACPNRRVESRNAIQSVTLCARLEWNSVRRLGRSRARRSLRPPR